MVTSADCEKKYGPPQNGRNMTTWEVPDNLRVGPIPRHIYCNKDLISPLTIAIKNLIVSGASQELRTWDGCFCIRAKVANKSYSLHSWGIAVDVNASENPYKKKPKLSQAFVKCFKDAGFEWGGDWRTPDGMHFQLKKLPIK